MACNHTKYQNLTLNDVIATPSSFHSGCVNATDGRDLKYMNVGKQQWQS